jgi:hypothetical protein
MPLESILFYKSKIYISNQFGSFYPIHYLLSNNTNLPNTNIVNISGFVLNPILVEQLCQGFKLLRIIFNNSWRKQKKELCLRAHRSQVQRDRKIRLRTESILIVIIIVGSVSSESSILLKAAIDSLNNYKSKVKSNQNANQNLDLLNSAV